MTLIVRLRGVEGVKRIDVPETCTLQQLYLVAQKALGTTEFHLTADPQGNQMIPRDEKQTLQGLGVRNGEMVFVQRADDKKASTNVAIGNLKMDDVDCYLIKQNGRIPRQRNPQVCRHGESGMCAHCQPLEPYDARLLEERGIKHLSFQSYLRKLTSSSSSSSLTSIERLPVLEPPDYRVKPTCTRHAPYPEAICSACQPPSAITLNPQPFRFTDHVEFESPALIERFLADGWRRTGYQCFGWLYGKYEPYEGVPLGVKAVVRAIYEPPQDGSVDGFVLLEDEQHDNQSSSEGVIQREERLTESVAAELGLVRIGMIYTDLRDDGQGKVERRRGPDTFFLSSAEVIWAAQQQSSHPNRYPGSSTGTFGSKFVTVVLSGDEEGAVSVFAYQVNVTAMALVEAGLIQATTDPSLMMVVSTEKVSTSSSDRVSSLWTPDIIYSYQSEYGGQVSARADPTFPVDYLIVSLSHGFPRQDSKEKATSTATESSVLCAPTQYPPLYQKPTRDTLRRYLLPLPQDRFARLRLFANFNLLVYLRSQTGDADADADNDKNKLSPTDWHGLIEAMREGSPEKLDLALNNSKFWSHIINSKSDGDGSRHSPINLAQGESIDSQSGRESASTGPWTCPHCTFINPASNGEGVCEICNLPRHF